MPPNDDGKGGLSKTGGPLLMNTTIQINGSTASINEHENKTEHHSDVEQSSSRSESSSTDHSLDCIGVTKSEMKDMSEKECNGLEQSPLETETNPNMLEYRVYPERWWLLSAVLLLNVSNYAHWVAFPVVAKTGAKYYNQSGDKMDLIPTLSYGLGVPCCLLATYVVERHGLKHGLQIGGFLTGIGGLLCFCSSLPPLSNDLTTNTRYQLALIGQALTGIACPFIACVPTKISQHWFADEQRTIATALLGLSGSMGCILGLAITPQFVHEKDDITIMNSVWFVPAAIGSLLTMWKVRTNYPPLPPSPSAADKPKAKSIREWMGNIKLLFTNRAFIIIFLFLGACMGCLSSVMTKMEQMLCARGYTDQLSGLSAALIFACAAIASIPIGLLAFKLGAHWTSFICKGFIAIGLCGVATSAYFMRLPDQPVGIIISCIVMGGFAAGAYPLALELVVECTYPIDQATSTSFIFMSSALQGVILMGLENFLHGDLDEAALERQKCYTKTDDMSEGHQEPRDYSSYLNALAIYCWSFFIIFVVGFRTEMKRSKADQLYQSTEQQKPEITMLLEPTKQPGGIALLQDPLTDAKDGKNEFYIIKKDKDNNVEIFASNVPDKL